MSRGPIPNKSIEAALAAARGRGIVSLCRRSRESVCDIVIHAPVLTINAMIRRCRRLHGSHAEMETPFWESLAWLRLVPDAPCRSRELWACSPYGVLRFFRVTNAGLVELDSSGHPFTTGTATGGGSA
jgi:hypothetical protein